MLINYIRLGGKNVLVVAILAKTSPDKSIIDQLSFIIDLSNTLSGALGLKSVILSQTFSLFKNS